MADGAPNGEKLRKQGEDWMARILAAEKREEEWAKDAKAAERAYSNGAIEKDDGKLYDFNILHSNVETIVPAIYNSTPVPDIRPRGNKKDPLAKSVSDLLEAAIAVQTDDNRLDAEVESTAQDGFLSGRGITRVRFHADTEHEPVVDPATGQPMLSETGEPLTQEVTRNERVYYESVSWRDYRRGPAKRWDQRPWEAYRQVISREEAERIGDADLLAAQKDEAAVQSDDTDDADLTFWEIWCRDTRKVYFVQEGTNKVYKVEDDPMGLSGFFPTKEPVQPITLTGRLTPICPFSIYRKLADELDLCTKRINAIMKGLKVRGIAAGNVADIQRLSQADDNELVASTDLEGLAATKGLENAILWWPVEQSAKVLQQLYVQRDQIRQAIYEITGISDIVRGASDAGETATAQQIKTQWGSLRIQKMQRLIQRHVRDLFIITAELIATKFSPQTLQQMTGMQVTPEMQQLLSDQVLSYYRVDIESDSTIRADLTRQKAEMAEFMQGTGNYFGTMGPLVEQAPPLAGPVTEIYSAFARIFNLGKQAEDALEQMAEMAKQAGQKPRPNPEAEKAKAEMEAKKMDAAIKQEQAKADMAMKQQNAATEQQARMQELQLKRELASIDVRIKLIDLEIAQRQLAIKEREAQIGLAAKQAETSLKLTATQQSNQLKLDAQRKQAKQKETAQ